MSDDDRLDALLRRIKRRRRSVEAYLSVARPRTRRLANISIVSSALASLLLAGPAVGGESFANQVVDMLGLAKSSQVWQPLCLAAAVCSFIAAVSANLNKSRNAEANIVSAEACRSELEGLEALIESGQITLERSAELYQQYVTRIPFVPDEAPARKRPAPRNRSTTA